MDDAERAAYEAAMTENMLLRAVLDDLKAAGSDLRSISNRRKTELGERLRAATGLPLREDTAFLRISRSSYEYHRARLGRDKHATLRDEVETLFRSMGGFRGYRAVHAELSRRGRRVSEKDVRRLMRERGLTVARRRRSARSGACRVREGAATTRAWRDSSGPSGARCSTRATGRAGRWTTAFRMYKKTYTVPLA